MELDELIFIVPNETNIERKTAAIMFTDIAGYTETMSQSEQKALEMLRKKRTIIKSLIDDHNGKYVKEIGDGTLSYFDSGYNASSCAKELQKEVTKEDLKVRVGIHIGDIVFDNNDVYGDGVNIASRLESLAPAGGVLVSRNVYDELINKDGFDGVPLGLQSLKGVGRLVEVYAIKDEFLVIPKIDEYKDTEIETHKDDEVPSLAIVPFENKGADEDVFYAYGISADLISDCSGAGLIRVTGLKDIEKVNFQEMTYNQLSESFLVRYIAQGTLWKMGEMFQLSIELYDTKENKLIWSDRWQENWANLSNIKKNLSEGLLAALDTRPVKEIKPNSNNPEAYEFYLKAKHKYNKLENFNDLDLIQGLLKRSIELDNHLLEAKNLLGATYSRAGNYTESKSIFEEVLVKAKETSDERNLANCLMNMGNLYNYKGEPENAISSYKESQSIYEIIENKSGYIKSNSSIGRVYTQIGELDKALEYLKKSLLLNNELDDQINTASIFNNIANNYRLQGDYHKTLDYAKKAFQISEQIGYEPHIADMLSSIALAYCNIDQNDKSIEYLKKALIIIKTLGDKRSISTNLHNLGAVTHDKAFYEDHPESFADAINYLEESLKLQKEISGGLGLHSYKTTMFLFHCYKNIGKKFDENELKDMVVNHEYIEYEDKFLLYRIFEDKDFLKKSYEELQITATKMDQNFKEKFMGYLIQKTIISDYQKVFG